uniref:Uncharacterized protein n=1 Tax=Arundo donax TaxID=35708 RepID=A0A0A9HEV3_ARUDO
MPCLFECHVSSNSSGTDSR